MQLNCHLVLNANQSYLCPQPTGLAYIILRPPSWTKGTERGRERGGSEGNRKGERRGKKDIGGG